MFQEEFNTIVSMGEKKLGFLKGNRGGYFLASCLAGLYVGLGIILIFTIGGYLDGSNVTKIVMGICFGIALSLVIMAGSELFTGNVMIMAANVMTKTAKVSEGLWLWLVCYLGNWVGSIIVALLFWGTGLADGDTGTFIAQSAVAKTSVDLIPLFLRGFLCNVLVCLAVWCGYKMKSESGKLIMIFWCLFAFITSGYEHSVANMTLLTIALLTGAEPAIGFDAYFYNIFVVTLGNIVGAILVMAIPYYIISKNKGPKEKIKNIA